MKSVSQTHFATYMNYDKLRKLLSMTLVVAFAASLSASADAKNDTKKPKKRKPQVVQMVDGQNPAKAAPKAAPAQNIKPPAAPLVYEVTPDVLRERLITGNVSVLTGLNQIYQSKEAVNGARARLLPSINVAGAISSGPAFMLSSVSFLMPFLLPSNWFNLSTSEHQMVADGIAFYLVELNAMAQAYALFETIVGDLTLRKTLQEQVEVLKKIQDVVETKVNTGLAPKTDLDQATAQLQIQQIQVSKTDELIGQETEVVRHAMAITDIDATINFAEVHPPALKNEGARASEIYAANISIAPELQQLDALAAASKSSKWSKVFSFLSGASLNPASGKSGVDFGTMSGNGTATLGLGLVTDVRISNLNIEQVKLRRKEAELQLAATIASAVKSLKQALLQLSLATEAQAHYQNAFDAQLLSYETGLTDLLHVLDASTNLLTASLAKANAQIDVDSQRINLARITLDDQFAQVPKCKMNGREDSGGLFGWFTDIVDSGSAETTIDQLCRGKAARN